MKRKFILAFLLCQLLNCNDKSNTIVKSTFNCNTPISTTCNSDSCGYWEIYTDEGIKIGEGIANVNPRGFGYSWYVGDYLYRCGRYKTKITLIVKSNIQNYCNDFLMPGTSRILIKDRTRCNAMKDTCHGIYIEGGTATFNPNGYYGNDTGCICCQ